MLFCRTLFTNVTLPYNYALDCSYIVRLQWNLPSPITLNPLLLTSGSRMWCHSSAIAAKINIGECQRSQRFYFEQIHEFQQTANHLGGNLCSRVRTTSIAVNANHGPVATIPRVHRAPSLSTHRIIHVRYPVGCVATHPWLVHFRVSIVNVLLSKDAINSK